jgi:predicted RNase H-like HicB family nuclease
MKAREVIKLVQADSIEGGRKVVPRILIVVEKANGNFSAYCPDLPGCIATGETKREAEQNIREAIKLHIEGLKEDNLPIPESSAIADYVLIS